MGDWFEYAHWGDKYDHLRHQRHHQDFCKLEFRPIQFLLTEIQSPSVFASERFKNI